MYMKILRLNFIAPVEGVKTWHVFQLKLVSPDKLLPTEHCMWYCPLNSKRQEILAIVLILAKMQIVIGSKTRVTLSTS